MINEKTIMRSANCYTQNIAGARHTAGMTLIELMVVVLIIGILAGVGYPSYRDYVMRAKRADGKALLMDAAARMERLYFDKNRYTVSALDIGYGAVAPTSAEQNYVLSAVAGATGSINTSYLLTATPNASKTPAPHTDVDCGNLTLDSRGTRGITGATPATVESCWGR
jgi:type IV pilus assembly protein PilE